MTSQTHVLLYALSVGLLLTATDASAFQSVKGAEGGIIGSPHKIDIGPVDGPRTVRHPSPPNAAGKGCQRVAILEANPADGTTDARQPFGPADDPTDPAARQGIGSAAEPIVLTLGSVGLGAECFAICETNPDAVLGANGIASVTEGPAGVYTIVLEHAIAPGEWTNLFVGVHASVAYLALPADSNADGLSNANDVLALINMLNGAVEPPFGMFSMDIDHSGASNASDILRIIDLLNGGGNLEIWLGAAAPDNECEPLVCGPGAGDCCENNGADSPGCDDADCCECICAVDPFCCDTTWDLTCALEACGGFGSPCEPVCDCGPCCGNGTCDITENCEICPEDCGPCCGNGSCDPDEDCESCPQDCGPCCGDIVCDPDEDCQSCPEDCGPCCGNGSCDPDEDCESCAADCGPCPPCPGDGDCCEGNGPDSPGCDDADCCDCVCLFDPFCCDATWDTQCSLLACGEFGSPCLADCGCGPCCGNGTCDFPENCESCPRDCGPCCGNGTCDPDEDCVTCSKDCGPCACGSPGTGDCFQFGGNGTPFCEDAVCCKQICAGDPFCCNTEWDGQCAGNALANCPGAGGSCCDANGTPGCQSEFCLFCVCGLNPFCCDNTWDAQCAGEACDVDCIDSCDCCLCGNGLCDPIEDCESCPEDCGPCCGNGSCDFDEDCESCPDDCGPCPPCPGDGDCCAEGGNGSPGCDDTNCCECICACDPFCCETTWDAFCAGSGQAGGCGASSPNGPCVEPCSECLCGKGNGTCDPGEDCLTCPNDCGPCACGSPGTGDCFQLGGNGSPFCEDAVCCKQVCAGDAFCCDSIWDESCASDALANCPGAGGSCCDANGTPGCQSEGCLECVCELNPFCCDNTWDAQCAGEACDADCGDSCDCCLCGNDSCDPIEDCESCPEDCGPCCGNGECGVDEDCESCPKDCGPCPPCPGDGDCCEDNGPDSPGCDNADCCDCVCAIDPFCCRTTWDIQCAGNAAGACADACPGCGCGSPGLGDCCAEGGNDTPFCDDAACCECICACDSFCCEDTWDASCAGQGIDGVCGASNPNSGCASECSECLVPAPITDPVREKAGRALADPATPLNTAPATPNGEADLGTAKKSSGT